MCVYTYWRCAPHTMWNFYTFSLLNSVVFTTFGCGRYLLCVICSLKVLDQYYWNFADCFYLYWRCIHPLMGKCYFFPNIFIHPFCHFMLWMVPTWCNLYWSNITQTCSLLICILKIRKNFKNIQINLTWWIGSLFQP